MKWGSLTRHSGCALLVAAEEPQKVATLCEGEAKPSEAGRQAVLLNGGKDLWPPTDLQHALEADPFVPDPLTQRFVAYSDLRNRAEIGACERTPAVCDVEHPVRTLSAVEEDLNPAVSSVTSMGIVGVLNELDQEAVVILDRRLVREVPSSLADAPVFLETLQSSIDDAVSLRLDDLGRSPVIRELPLGDQPGSTSYLTSIRCYRVSWVELSPGQSNGVMLFSHRCSSGACGTNLIGRPRSNCEVACTYAACQPCSHPRTTRQGEPDRPRAVSTHYCNEVTRQPLEPDEPVQRRRVVH